MRVHVSNIVDGVAVRSSWIRAWLFGACEKKKTPQVQVCPKTFVHDCSLETLEIRIIRNISANKHAFFVKYV